MKYFSIRNQTTTLFGISLLIILACVLAAGSVYADEAGASDVRFAVIGDYGNASAGVADVAYLLDGWGTDFIITVGDNRYSTRNFDETVGQFYCAYLRDAGSGTFCPGGTSITNDFYPSPGNHDYMGTGDLSEYLAYFTLPGVDDISSRTSGMENYYDFVRGPVHFFVLDSQAVVDSSANEAAQKDWLQEGLAQSTSPWQIVYFHHSPYTSGLNASTPFMRWPFAAWGADAVISGHHHVYERIHANGTVYFVDGLGGASTYDLDAPVPLSQVSYNSGFGAMLVDADNNEMNIQFINTSGTVIDTYTISEQSSPGIADAWIESSMDDVEQRLSDGVMYTDSSDIELGNDTEYFGEQNEGLRFRNVYIPRGSIITGAYLEFVVDETGTLPAVVAIRAEDTGNAPEFTETAYDLTNRSVTSSAVSWDIPVWDTVGAVFHSPDLSEVVQEVIDRGDWQPDNSLAFIISGTGTRVAESWDGDPASAAVLHVEFSPPPPPNIPPAASFMISTMNRTANFTDASTDSDGTISTWQWSFGDGAGSSEQNPSHTYASNGTYSVTLTVTDNAGDSGSATQTLTVTAPPDAPSGLKAKALSARRIKLQWTDNSDNELGFRIERSLNGTLWEMIASVGPNRHKYRDKGLETHTTYYYRVTAYNDEGISEPSNIARARTHAAASMHVSNIKGSAKKVWRIWLINATVTLKDDAGHPVKGAWIRGDWSRGVFGSKACVTRSDGACSFRGISSLRNKSAEFRVTSVHHKKLKYDPDDNVLSSITIHRPH